MFQIVKILKETSFQCGSLLYGPCNPFSHLAGPGEMGWGSKSCSYMEGVILCIKLKGLKDIVIIFYHLQTNTSNATLFGVVVLIFFSILRVWKIQIFCIHLFVRLDSSQPMKIGQCYHMTHKMINQPIQFFSIQMLL